MNEFTNAISFLFFRLADDLVVDVFLKGAVWGRLVFTWETWHSEMPDKTWILKTREGFEPKASFAFDWADARHGTLQVFVTRRTKSRRWVQQAISACPEIPASQR